MYHSIVFIYYLLAKSNPFPTFIVKGPTDKAEIKRFLGYEWSSRKGDEGIKYLNTSVEGEDEVLTRKGLNSIQTPLFNPKDLDDTSRINTLVRSYYLEDPIPFSEKLSSYCSTIRMEEMIDFKRTEFDMGFSFSQTKRKVSISSKYPIIWMEDFPAIIRKGTSITKKKAKEGEYKVVAGGIDYAYTHSEYNRSEHTITISAFGANAGYVNYWSEKIFASDCTTINVGKVVSTLYIYNYLKSKQNDIFSLARGAAQPRYNESSMCGTS